MILKMEDKDIKSREMQGISNRILTITYIPFLF